MNTDYIILKDKKYKITDALVDALMDYTINVFDTNGYYNETIDSFIKNSLPYIQEKYSEYIDAIPSYVVRNGIFDEMHICLKNALNKYAEDPDRDKAYRISCQYYADNEDDMIIPTLFRLPKYKISVYFFEYRKVISEFTIRVTCDISYNKTYFIQREIPVNCINDYFYDNNISLDYYE